MFYPSGPSIKRHQTLVRLRARAKQSSFRGDSTEAQAPPSLLRYRHDRSGKFDIDEELD